MRKYIIRRILLMIPTTILATLLVFLLMKLAPGDVAMAIVYGLDDEVETSSTQEEAERRLEEIRERLGLNDPLPVQYGRWLWAVARGHLGDSIWQYRPVIDIVKERFPRTAELGLLILFLNYAQAVPLGVIAAVKQNTFTDQIIRIYSIVGLSVPTIWVGTLFLFIFSRYVGWIPPIDWKSLTEDPLHNLQIVLVPAIIVTIGGSASATRMTRSQVLEVLREDYIRTAWAKGLGSKVVLVRHALRNALLPVITQFGGQLSSVLTGIVIVETIFHIPGMGKSMVDAISARDYPVLQGLVLVNVGIVLVINLVVDLLYSVIDPRIRYA